MSTDESLPEVLYHYCDVGGFMGIMQSKCLWLSHAGYMNDYSEYKWLFEKTKKHFDRLATEGYTEYCEFMSVTDPSPPFICCFSSKPDLLSQWRAYSNDGAGFAIGFSLATTLETYRYASPFPARRVIYDEDEQDAEIERAIGKSFQVFGTETDNISAILALGRLALLASSCKNPGFREEQEWRLVHSDNGMVELPRKFRANAKNQLVSYCDFAFGVDSVPEIRLGPKNSARGDHAMVESFLAANGYPADSIKIVNSEATYR